MTLVSGIWDRGSVDLGGAGATCGSGFVSMSSASYRERRRPAPDWGVVPAVACAWPTGNDVRAARTGVDCG